MGAYTPRRTITSGAEAGRVITPAARAYQDATARFIGQQGDLATDVWEAQMQGLDPADFYAYTPVLLRMADGATGSRREGLTRSNEETKECQLIQPQGVTVQRGAQLRIANGQQYLVTDTYKTTGGRFKAVRAVQQYGILDFYGRPIYTPVIITNPQATGTEPKGSGSTVLIADNRITAAMPYTAATADFYDNSRLIFGTTAYTAQGVNNYTRENSSDAGSVRLIYFTLDRDQLQPSDDTERGIAGGLDFSFTLTVHAAEDMTPGATQQAAIIATRNGETVTSTPAHPLTYKWSSDNESAASVDAAGNITALSAGEATITATLEENPDITGSVTVTVAASIDPAIEWITPPPESIGAYESATFEAAYFDDQGAQTADAITYTITGGSSGDYTKSQSGNRLTITSYTFLYAKLTVTAAAHGLTKTADIYLD